MSEHCLKPLTQEMWGALGGVCHDRVRGQAPLSPTSTRAERSFDKEPTHGTCRDASPRLTGRSCPFPEGEASWSLGKGRAAPATQDAPLSRAPPSSLAASALTEQLWPAHAQGKRREPSLVPKGLNV